MPVDELMFDGGNWIGRAGAISPSGPSPYTGPLLGHAIVLSDLGAHPSYAYYNPNGQTKAQYVSRLLGAYGNSAIGKAFPNTIVSTWRADYQQLNNTKAIICMSWANGAIAAGTHDAALTSFAASIPAGVTAMVCMNEVDNHAGATPAYVADMDHLYDLAQTLNATNPGKLEVWDCFMQYALQAASGPAYNDSWTNPAKRHGIIWDLYWNQYTLDASGNTFVGSIEAVHNRLGIPWGLGETGDRRPGTTAESGNNPAPSDAARAARLTTHMNRLFNANPAPKFICYFDYVGSTGDHRILTENIDPSLSVPGPDTLTYNVLKGYFDAMNGGM